MGKLKNIFRILRSLPATLRFNLHYFPLSQALKLPVLLYKPRLVALRGRVELTSSPRFGMVRLGFQSISLYPSSGIMFENRGGTLRLGDNVFVGSASAISIGEKGTLEIGDTVMANAAIKLICYHHIKIGDRCRLGWESMMMDTDFHAMTKPDGTLTRGYNPITLDHDCWLGTGVLVLKGSRLPAYTTVQARSTLAGHALDIPERSIIGTDSRVIVKKTGIYRDLDNDTIEY